MMFFGVGHVGRQGIAAKVGGAIVSASPTLDLSFMGPTLDPSLTFTRASTATYFDSSGVMQTAAMNLALQSGNLANAAWTPGGTAGAPVVTANQTTAPDGTLTAARVVYPAVSGAQYSNVNQNITITFNPYAWSVWLRGNVGGEQVYLSTTYNGVLFYSTGATLTTNWQRFTLVTPALSGATGWFWQIGVDLRDATETAKPTQTVYAWGAQVELGTAATPYIPTTTAANGAPRFDYDPVTHAARGLLIEEARTNLAFASIPAGTYTVGNATLVQAAGTAPDGTNTFVKLNDTAVTQGHYAIAPLATTVASQPYSGSVYAKAGDYRYLQLILDNNAGVGTFATFDLQTGTITGAPGNNGGSTASTASIQSIGGGVYRCMISTNMGANTTARLAMQNSIVAAPAGQFGGNQYAGVAGQGLYIWGAQLEQGAFPTSYIPTTAAAVTRAYDSCFISSANMSPWFASPGGSWMAEFVNNVPTAASTSPRVIGIHDASAIAPLWAPTDGHLASYDGAVVETVNSVVVGAVSKGASNWTPGTGKVCLNGGAIGLGSPQSTGYSTLATAGVGILGGNPGTVNETMTGYIRRVRYWPRVLSDAEMQSVTT